MERTHQTKTTARRSYAGEGLDRTDATIYKAWTVDYSNDETAMHDVDEETSLTVEAWHFEVNGSRE